MHNSTDQAADVSRETNALKAVLGAALVPLKLGRVERYCRRFDAHLDTLPDERAKRLFCDRELANWVERYEAFALAVDSGRLVPDEVEGPTAFDYTLTISEICTRQACFPEVRS